MNEFTGNTFLNFGGTSRKAGCLFRGVTQKRGRLGALKRMDGSTGVSRLKHFIRRLRLLF